LTTIEHTATIEKVNVLNEEVSSTTCSTTTCDLIENIEDTNLIELITASTSCKLISACCFNYSNKIMIFKNFFLSLIKSHKYTNHTASFSKYTQEKEIAYSTA